MFLPFLQYFFQFSLPLALYGTIVVVVLKDVNGHSMLVHNISSVSFKDKSEEI